MVWGCFWGRNRGPIVPLPQKSITSHIYQQMLHKYLLPFLRQIDVTLGDPVFQQDNASVLFNRINTNDVNGKCFI